MLNSLLKSIFGRWRDRDPAQSPSPSLQYKSSRSLRFQSLPSDMHRNASAFLLDGEVNFFPTGRGHMGEDDRMRELESVLHELQVERDENTVTPFPPPNDGQGDYLTAAIRKCQEAIGAAEILAHLAVGRQGRSRELLLRLLGFLEGQKAELFKLSEIAQGLRSPALHALRKLYEQATESMEETARLREDEVSANLSTLVDVFSEGPDYLIDVTIIEIINMNANVVNESFGAKIRQALDQALAEQSRLTFLRQAAKSIVALGMEVPEEQLRGQVEQKAYRVIGLLIRQLQARIDGAETPSQFAVSDEISSGVASKSSPGPKRSDSVPSQSLNILSAISGSNTPNGHQTYTTATELQEKFGTGKRMSLPPSIMSPETSPRPPPSPRLSESSEDSEQELWEYRGHLLTRSALSLVLRQEALAMADSSGNYSGQVSWDDVRKAWIPKWAEKLKPEDVLEGEVPNLNPRDYKVRTKDQWGNKIGWRNGVMYYEEEPSFELRE